jgi:hypothetical protein
MAGKTPYPLPGALCPIIALSLLRNLYSKRMGVLGEYPRAEMISKLEAEVNKWQKADSSLIAPCFTLHCRNCSRCLEETICTACECF